MSGYVGDDEATRRVLREGGWYTGLGDVCFWLTDPCDGERDYYWVSRESAMLTRGGAKYSCAQVEAELREFVVEKYGLARDGFDVAVVGLRVGSEHEDACCVTIELTSEAAQAKRAEIERTFLSEARGRVTKGARPDRLRFAGIPRNFKGAVQLPELKAQCLADIQSRADIVSSQ
jgi:acyl-CoA synthetase (AMP-forming)/AMP-acid ligase II